MASKIHPDHWSTNLVLLAKNSYVWLHQLSAKYERPIKRLNDIPDQELAELADQGFTGIWLIGIWERSVASENIKRMCGNPVANASAYSIRKYAVAKDLGGNKAVRDLQTRAIKFGIRIGSDMVPNHTAIDSEWVLKHPEWFLSADTPPYPSYSFNGPDLSPDSDISIQIEDHYYNRSDAAVVFKRTDKRTGEARYIYHGNDGTNMPWNDTAQLDYTKPEVRAQVLKTILAVARQFPIIRFDAAMTLTRHHYHRLWFPPFGAHDFVPSRERYGMDGESFRQYMPEEFWRSVVTEIDRKLPDTLLLAEAFWFTEGIFVQDLEMHRVYFSAFMNMLRDEENTPFRQIITNTLAFDASILQHYTFFMSNPDEKTAVEQFGKFDKYFGICTLMCTLPGMPMFNHGQLLGYTEKYGMEFKKPWFDELPDLAFLKHHYQYIFPLLRKRPLFADITNFYYYDFKMLNNWTNDSVYVYSNRDEHDSFILIYHNKFRETEGWVNNAVTSSTRQPESAGKLCDGVKISGRKAPYIHFDDLVTCRTYSVPRDEFEERGLHLRLHAYELHVLTNFRYKRKPV